MKQYGIYLSAVGFLAASILVAFWDTPIAYLSMMLAGMDVVSYAVYILILAAAVVFMPLTAMPIVPIAASMFGPLVTALLSIVGWIVGATIAFLIARHVGRPILARFVSLETLDRYVSTLPADTRFLMIVLLHLTLPVDIVAYALGFANRITLREYVPAAALGVSAFAFGFAYLGNALTTGNMPLLIALGGILLLVFLGGWYVLKMHVNKG